jgi:uncharacterized protein YqjF (DUF2071 family)
MNGWAVNISKCLKRHPFPVQAWFERVVAVSFAFPEATLRTLVPDTLEIDTYKGFGFVTVAMVWTKGLRPVGFPTFLGQDFFLAGYRVFARLRDDSGRRLRGLKILRSETNKPSMVWLGNLMTGYRYRRVAIQIHKSGQDIRVETSLEDGSTTLNLTFESPVGTVALPEGSPFDDWKTARLFAGPMPFTFSPEDDGSFVVIEGKRQNWEPRPVFVKQWQVSLFDAEPLRGTTPILANAFIVEGVSYRWKKGRIVRPGGVP